jgi:peptidoglycan/LPS O-acetylase OafA/YrhL
VYDSGLAARPVCDRTSRLSGSLATSIRCTWAGVARRSTDSTCPQPGVALVNACCGRPTRDPAAADLSSVLQAATCRRDVCPETRLVTAAPPHVTQPSRLARPPALSGGYRPALDGVRAVAVLSVITYHLGEFPGGFLGVDVFFVLSGYLITGLLLQERATTGRISIRAFWARRARRLLPALLLLLAVSALVAGHNAPVETLAARRADTFAALFYYANWHFIASSQSYFATSAGLSPLLHTWSLAIEEQFYLLWPVILLGLIGLASRRPRILVAIILTGAGVSAVAMAALYSETDPNRSYLGTDTRAHALLLGAALAALLHSRPSLLAHPRARLLAALSWPVAAVAVGLPLLTFRDQGTAYYHGGSALFAVAVVFSLWIVEARPHGVPAAALTLAPARWIGRISYGLYLWHWPLIVWVGMSGSRMLKAKELALTFAVATASFYMLERPVRLGRVPWLGTSSRRLLASASVGAALIVALTVQATTITNSLARQVNDTSDSDCPIGSPAAGDFAWCVRTLPANASSPVVAVIGDSTSRALDPGMRVLAAARGWSYIQAGALGCSVLPLVLPNSQDPSDIAVKRRCPPSVVALTSQVEARYRPDVWIISDRFGVNALVQPNGQVLAPGDPRRDVILEAAMRTTLARLTAQGAQALVIAPPPRGEPVECATHKPAAPECAGSLYTLRDRATASLDRLFRQAVAAFPDKAAYVTVDDILCPGGTCVPALDGLLVRFDGVHYTASFSRHVVPILITRGEQAGIQFHHRGNRAAGPA